MATATAHTDAAVDQGRVEEFLQKAVGDGAGMMAGVMAVLGDRLGLFRELAAGPATSTELAERTGTNERYAREWLRGMYAAGYLEYERGTGRFTLPREHAEVLASDGAPYFLGGAYALLLDYVHTFDRLTEAFRSGGGVPQWAYPIDTWEDMCRFSRPFYEHRLVQEWIPAVAGASEKLERGARYADVGCGAGLAVVKLAEAFPRSTFVGYDTFEPQIERARRAAHEAGVSERVRFEVLDASRGLPQRFDIVSTFDVVHDAADPVGLLRGIRRGLADDGVYVMLEINSADDLADNHGPVATLLYGVSMVYCMTTSLAHGGAGLGTCGCPPAKARELCMQAGFSSVERLPIEDPFNILYAVRP